MTRRILAAMVFPALAFAGWCGAAQAEDVSITVRIAGTKPPTGALLGQGANLPPMTFKRERRAFFRNIEVPHLDPQVYQLVLEYDEKAIALPLRLHRNSRPIDLPAHFDGPQACRERDVRDAETPAGSGNLREALRKYMLAVHLSSIDDPRRLCRDSQPPRLKKARIDRGIQLATFRGSPFLPPEADEREWEESLGRDAAARYREQIARSRVVQLEQDRQAAIRSGEFGKASEINSVLLAQSEASEIDAEVLAKEGIPKSLLESDQPYLLQRARNRGQQFELATPMEQ